MSVQTNMASTTSAAASGTRKRRSTGRLYGHVGLVTQRDHRQRFCMSACAFLWDHVLAGTGPSFGSSHALCAEFISACGALRFLLESSTSRMHEAYSVYSYVDMTSNDRLPMSSFGIYCVFYTFAPFGHGLTIGNAGRGGKLYREADGGGGTQSPWLSKQSIAMSVAIMGYMPSS
ncbi:hypothetical protein PENSPDRAFT_289387 [Peniophora sp. CONT]|nr:hypothetical protein PENSPDRAFT_289387 [Peniophora sp. CONT]